jgi:hypothetical protein
MADCVYEVQRRLEKVATVLFYDTYDTLPGRTDRYHFKPN